MERLSIKLIEVSGFASAITALHLPHGKDPVYYPQVSLEVVPETNEDSPIQIRTESWVKMTPKELKLMQRLVKSGDQHAKVIRGITVGVLISAPIWFYRELETYNIGRQRLSSESTMHLECKGLSGEELMEAKDQIPTGHIQRTVDTISYQTLRRIYFQRRHHRLPIWHQFCDWIKTLPFAEQLITTEYEYKD